MPSIVGKNKEGINMKYKALKILGVILPTMQAASISTFAMANQLPTLCNMEEYYCAAASGSFIVSKKEELTEYVHLIEQGAEQYQKYFGNTPSTVVLVLGGMLTNEEATSLKNDGYKTILPWVSEEDKQKLIKSSIRRQILVAKPDLPEAVLEQLVEETLKKTNGGKKAEQNSLSKSGIPHEFSHLWYIHDFWPKEENLTKKGVRQYGGKGPDWLDEIAAILAEGEQLTASRTNMLADIVKRNEMKNELWSFDEYFYMEHPVFKQAQKLIAQRGGVKEGAEAMVIAIDDKDLNLSGKKPAAFYAQSRGFADFMIEITNDVHIFAHISLYLAKGGSIIEWLRSEGHRYNLPPSLHELEIKWMDWLKLRYF